MPPDQAVWFAESVRPHEPALRAFLSRRFGGWARKQGQGWARKQGQVSERDVSVCHHGLRAGA